MLERRGAQPWGRPGLGKYSSLEVLNICSSDRVTVQEGERGHLVAERSQKGDRFMLKESQGLKFSNVVTLVPQVT